MAKPCGNPSMVPAACENGGRVVSNRLRITVAYDGRPFDGWQSQARGNTIQDHLETAFAKLCGGPRITIHGSGRTDAGVHAVGQVAHADVPDRARHTPERWRGALNSYLPAEIRVMSVRFARADFHARFAARGKVYRYRIWNSPVLDPLEHGRAWHFPHPLDLQTLQRTAGLLLGRHDFAGFAANRGKPDENTVRTIRRIAIRRRSSLITLDFEGDGFLYKMVRLLTGTMARCAQGRASTDWIRELLGASGRKTSFAAPAEGLYLRRVLYEKSA